jgi:hypothetical protein
MKANLKEKKRQTAFPQDIQRTFIKLEIDMNSDICTKFDPYVRDLLNNKLMISWIISLNDGTTVYGDYDRPGYENCWLRLKKHCKANNLFIVKIELYMFGAQHFVFFEDPNGLDGVSIYRGTAREQSMSGDFRDFQFLTVCLLNDSCDFIKVKKFVWPQNEFEETDGIRLVTSKNLEHMIFKNDSEKIKSPKLQEYLNGAAV